MMTLWEYYLQYFSQIVEQALPAPQGIILTQTEETARALELQKQIMDMGIAEFVRACAQMNHTEIPEDVYHNFSLEDVQEILAQLPMDMEQTPSDAGEAQEDTDSAPSQPRCAYEVLLDCCFLEENMMDYLLNLLKEKDEKGFWQLAQVTTRTDMSLSNFLYWMATLEDRADAQERACSIILDACFDRLIEEKDMELMAGLLAGDQTIFETFRCEAPELKNLPIATYDWYITHYLDRFYPVRVIMKSNAIMFPPK